MYDVEASSLILRLNSIAVHINASTGNNKLYQTGSWLALRLADNYSYIHRQCLELQTFHDSTRFCNRKGDLWAVQEEASMARQR